MSEREEWITIIRNEYDQAPAHYRMGDDWDDGAGRIADAILADVALAYERGRRDMAKEVFALHEDTVEKYHTIAERDTEGRQGAYSRGRIVEAKSIANAIGAILPPQRS